MDFNLLWKPSQQRDEAKKNGLVFIFQCNLGADGSATDEINTRGEMRTMRVHVIV